MKTKSQKLALLGIWTALLFVIFYLETLISSVWSITPPAILSLSVLFTLCLFDDWRTGFVGGIIFGVSSLIIAALVGNAVFVLPWNSVLPRLFVGIGAYGAYALVKRLTKNAKNKFVNTYLPYAVGAGVGTLINTICVIAVLALFNMELFGNFTVLLEACITINFPIELACAVILVPVLSVPVKRQFGFSKPVYAFKADGETIDEKSAVNNPPSGDDTRREENL